MSGDDRPPGPDRQNRPRVAEGLDDGLDDGIEREEPPESVSGTDISDDVKGAQGLDDASHRRDDSEDGIGIEDGDFPIVVVEEAAPSVLAREISGEKDDQPVRHIIAVASGRGGAGKSLLAANMAVYLAQLGKRVIAVDADAAGGALNHMLGTPRPARGFGSFLRGRAETLDELAVDTPVAGVRLVAGEALPFGSVRSKVGARAVLTALRAMVADTVVVDLGPADSPLCIDVWLGADTPILVTLADPASIESTYRFMKTGFLRRLRGERGLDKLQAQLGRSLPSALDLYRAALEIGRSGRDDDPSAAPVDSGGQTRIPGMKIPAKIPALAATLANAIASYRPRFVVSQTRSPGDTKLGPQMSMAAHRRLGHMLDYLGHVEADETVAAAGRRHRPVMAEFPEAKICKNIERIVRRVIAADAERSVAASPPRLEEEQTFYEILDTEPGVSDEEIRRAYRLLKEIYVSSSPAISGLFEESELVALHARATAAHDTLFAPERRRVYDLSLPEADLARAVRRAAQAPRLDAAVGVAVRTDLGSGATPVDIEGEITGAFLRKLREARGIELSEVAQRTKIGERHLRSIEEERFDELPAPVYVRGFVTQFARVLRIDPARAAENYIRRLHGASGPGIGTPPLKEV